MSLFSKRSLAAFVITLAIFWDPSAVQGQSLTFTTFAGPEGGPGFEDGIGSAARFSSPYGVATDSLGNIYVADSDNNTIRKISPSGAVTTLAGLAGNYGDADGTGSAARFTFPMDVAADGSGNVYVADSDNNTIRKITSAGVVTTLAGQAGTRGDADGTGSAARFDFPCGVAADSGGNIYVADSENHTIRKITPAGVVTTLAGYSGSDGSTDGTGSAARFQYPCSLAADSSGNVYVTDSENSTIRKITPAGEVTTLAGLASQEGSTDGTGNAARFSFPRGIATDSSGNVYVSDSGNYTIRKITPAGEVTTLAGRSESKGSVDATGSAARFGDPRGLALDSSGNVYVADSDNNTIRKVTAAGSVTTLAGLSGTYGSADGTGNAAQFSYPNGLATDSSGNVYVADSDSATIRKITTAGVVTTFAGRVNDDGDADGSGSAARFRWAEGVATDSSGNVYVADTYSHTIRKISAAGAVTTLAGLAGEEGSADGTGSAARFSLPRSVAADSSGNVYVADWGSSTIRKITPAGVVTTLAGLAESEGSEDGTGSAARFSGPYGVTTDSSGNVYVADAGNSTIRKITSARVVTTLAGRAGFSGSADGTGSTARFEFPTALATDSSGNVYVTDRAAIRKITPLGVTTTLAGRAEIFGRGDGTGSAARFNSPRGIALDSSGNVYVADTFNNIIRVGRPALADVATIDASTGSARSTRQLDVAPQTATSWQWSVIRLPADSRAVLSSTAIRNPTFIPDVPGLFTLRLIATASGVSSITTVDLTAEPAEAGRRRAVRR